MALCEECGLRPASIRLGMIVNGQKQEKRLCPECMAKMQKTLPGLNLGNLAGVLSGMMAGKNAVRRGHEQPPEDENYMQLSCLNCGTTYEEFQKSGMVGCSNCYKAFHEPIEALLTRVSGHQQHVGRVPGGKGSALSNKLAVDRLKQRLVRAIADEEYEEAALLRDRIRALTAQIDAKEPAGRKGAGEND